MKKKLMAVLLAATFLLSAIAGCSAKDTKKNPRTKETKDTKETTKVVDEIKDDDILFYSRSSNYAWGYHDSVAFFLGNGDMYAFSNGLNYANGHADIKEKLPYLIEHSEPIWRVDKDYLTELYNTAMAIDPDAEQIEESVACDMGQYSIYLMRDNGEQLIRSTGDVNISLKDSNFKKFSELWDKIEDHRSPGGTEILGLYTSEFPIISFNCGYLSSVEQDTRFVCKDYAQFKEACEYWGLDPASFSEFDEVCYEEVPFLVQFDMVPSNGYNLIHDAMAENYYTPSIYFLLSDDSYTPGSNDNVAAVMDGFVVAAPYLGYRTVEEIEELGWQVFEKEN